jgi:hypothetical protein
MTTNSDIPGAIITSALTVGVGLVVYGATQLAQRFWLDPATELMKTLGRATFVCDFYANVYSSPGAVGGDLAVECSHELRKCASDLLATLGTVRAYWVFRGLRQLPPKRTVQRIAGLLRGLSNASKVEDTPYVWMEANELRILLGMRNNSTAT